MKASVFYFLRAFAKGLFLAPFLISNAFASNLVIPTDMTKVTRVTSPGGCTIIFVPQALYGGDPNAVIPYYLRPKNLDPTRLSNTDLEICGLPERPKFGRFIYPDTKTASERYDEWLADVHKRLLRRQMWPYQRLTAPWSYPLHHSSFLQHYGRANKISAHRPGFFQSFWSYLEYSPQDAGLELYCSGAGGWDTKYSTTTAVTSIVIPLNDGIPVKTSRKVPHAQISYWAGIGSDYPSGAGYLAQAGVVDSITTQGTTYFHQFLAFYEYFPAAPFYVPVGIGNNMLTINPGDRINILVQLQSEYVMYVEITDETLQQPTFEIFLPLPTELQCNPDGPFCSQNGEYAGFVTEAPDVAGANGSARAGILWDFGNISFATPTASTPSNSCTGALPSIAIPNAVPGEYGFDLTSNGKGSGAALVSTNFGSIAPNLVDSYVGPVGGRGF